MYLHYSKPLTHSPLWLYQVYIWSWLGAVFDLNDLLLLWLSLLPSPNVHINVLKYSKSNLALHINVTCSRQKHINKLA